MGILDAPAVKRTPGVRIAGLGDSITANGHLDTGIAATSAQTGILGQVSGANWLMWASVISNGALRYVGCAATGGHTAEEIEEDHLPTILAARPDLCAVMAGTNNALNDADMRATLQRIWRTLDAAGIVPILCTLTPRDNDADTVKGYLAILNAWISEQARVNRWPLADFYTACATTDGLATWRSGYASDLVHPGHKGAKAMGQVINDCLVPNFVAPATPALPIFSTDASGTEVYSELGNPLFVDGNADGTPNNWTMAGTGASCTAGTLGGVVGNIVELTRGSADGFLTADNTMPVSEGDEVLLTCRIRSDVEGSSGRCTIRALTTNEAVIAFAWQDVTADIDLGVLSTVFTVPALGGQTSLKFQIRAGLASGAQIAVAQLLTRNLTDDGYDL